MASIARKPMTYGEGGTAVAFVLLALLCLVISAKAYTQEYAAASWSGGALEDIQSEKQRQGRVCNELRQRSPPTTPVPRRSVLKSAMIQSD